MDISGAFWPPVRRPGDTLSHPLDPSPKYPSPVCPQTYAPEVNSPRISGFTPGYNSAYGDAPLADTHIPEKIFKIKDLQHFLSPLWRTVWQK